MNSKYIYIYILVSFLINSFYLYLYSFFILVYAFYLKISFKRFSKKLRQPKVHHQVKEVLKEKRLQFNILVARWPVILGFLLWLIMHSQWNFKALKLQKVCKVYFLFFRRSIIFQSFDKVWYIIANKNLRQLYTCTYILFYIVLYDITNIK